MVYSRVRASPSKTSTVHQQNSYPNNSLNPPRKNHVPTLNSKLPLLTYPKSNPTTIKASPKDITVGQRAERRAKGLCYYCDDKYVMGHQRKKPSVFMMVAEDQGSEGYDSSPIFDEELIELT